MIQAADLIRLFQQSYHEKWGYIWGGSGQTWTAKKQAAATRDTTVKYGAQWIGRRVADCSGLFAWAFRELGGSIYHGSNTIWNKYCVRQGRIGSLQALIPGTAVFLVKNGNRHHIGLYVGNGKCIEAKGTRYGVVESELGHWDEWGLLRGVDYGDQTPPESPDDRPTLRRGDQGDLVKKAQELLIAKGFFCGSYGADGKFGPATEAAVKNLQSASRLKADGVIGEKTWSALEQEASAPPEPTDAEKLKKLWAWYQAEHGEIQNG